MKKRRKHYTPEEKVAILRRHLVGGVPISELRDASAPARRFRSKMRGDWWRVTWSITTTCV
jgi:transposase-like protein